MFKLLFQLFVMLASAALVLSDSQIEMGSTLVTQTSGPDGCYNQFFFLKVQPGKLPHCVAYPYDIFACGYLSNNQPVSLWNDNQNDENQFEVGIGVNDTAHSNALIATSFIQLNVSSLPGVGINFQHYTASTGGPIFTAQVFGSNTEGECNVPSKDDPDFNTRYLGDNIDFPYNTVDGIPEPKPSTDFIDLTYPNYLGYKYICVKAVDDANYPTQQVLLSQIRFTCNPTSEPTLLPTLTPTFHPTKSPTKKPTRQPTFKPTQAPSFAPTTLGPTSAPSFGPSVAPTSGPTLCHIHYYFNKLGDLTQCDYFTPFPSIRLCAETNTGTKVDLFNNNLGDDELEAGMGQTTNGKLATDNFIAVTDSGDDYYLQLCGYNEVDLEDMNLMMHHVDGDATFAWYGVNGNGVQDPVPLVVGDYHQNGVYLLPGNGQKSYKDYPCLNIRATHGKVLLSLIRYDC